MKQEQFEGIIQAQIDMIRDVLIIKAKEYATEDRLHNFRTVAILRDCTMEQALGGMLSKHTVSIYDMIESGKEYTSAQWDEKINYHIVYLLLLKAITVEKEIAEFDTSMDKVSEVVLKSVNKIAEQSSVVKNNSEQLNKLLYNHSLEANHFTIDELLLALEIKDLLTKHKILKDNGIVR